MTDLRGSRPGGTGFILGALVAAMMAIPAMADETAVSLSTSFRKAVSRARGSLVSVRIPDGLAAASPFQAPRPGRIGPPALWPPLEGTIRMPFSGVVIDAEKGHILTVDHTGLGAPQLLVTFPDGTERLTSQIRRDPRSGLALLAVDLQGLHPTPARWGDPLKLEAGDWLIALGQPGVGDPSLSVGVFSTRRRSGGEEWLETDAAITRVGAGGILINLAGEVVGICKLGSRRIDGFEGMGHALSADRARRIADDLSRFGQVRRAYLGVELQPPVLDVARAGPTVGVVVLKVVGGTPAAEAGIQPGDMLLSVGHRSVNSPGDVQDAVESATIGEQITLGIDRRGRRLEIKLTPRAMPGPVGTSRTPRSGVSPTPGFDPSRGGQVLPGLPPVGNSLPDGPLGSQPGGAGAPLPPSEP